MVHGHAGHRARIAKHPGSITPDNGPDVFGTPSPIIDPEY